MNISGEEIRRIRNQQVHGSACFQCAKSVATSTCIASFFITYLIRIMDKLFSEGSDTKLKISENVPVIETVLNYVFYISLAITVLLYLNSLRIYLRNQPWMKLYERLRLLFGRDLAEDAYDQVPGHSRWSYPRELRDRGITRNAVLENPEQEIQPSDSAENVFLEQPRDATRLKVDDEMPIDLPHRVTRASLQLTRSSNIVTEERQISSQQQHVRDTDPSLRSPNQADPTVVLAASKDKEIPQVRKKIVPIVSQGAVQRQYQSKAQKKIIPVVSQGVVEGQDESPVRRSPRKSVRLQNVLLPGQVSETTSGESDSRLILADHGTKSAKTKKKSFQKKNRIRNNQVSCCCRKLFIDCNQMII